MYFSPLDSDFSMNFKIGICERAYGIGIKAAVLETLANKEFICVKSFVFWRLSLVVLGQNF